MSVAASPRHLRLNCNSFRYIIVAITILTDLNTLAFPLGEGRLHSEAAEPDTGGTYGA